MTNRKVADRMNEIKKYIQAAGDFRYNVVSGKIEYKGKRITAYQVLSDYELNTLSVEMAKKNINCSPAQLKDIMESSITPKHNPFHEYLEGVPVWDGKTDYILRLAETIQVTNMELWKYSFKKWFVAMVGSLIEDEVINHTVLILSGAQGIGKSTWLYNLIPSELKNYYYSGIIKITSKDTLIMLSESMLINLEEIGYLGAKELNELKEIITKPNITFRRPYGRFNETIPRRASFAGSLNDKEFLTDTTGSRRFLSFEVNNIDYKQKSEVRNVYSQAKTLFEGNFKYWFDGDDINEIHTNNEQFRIKSMEEELLMATFEPCFEEENSLLMTATEVLNHLTKEYKLNLTNHSAQKLGKALVGNKFKRKKGRGGKQLYLLKLVDREKAEYLKRARFKSGND